jgi:nicotinamide mononucleotide (NMN) deamidase PncC
MFRFSGSRNEVREAAAKAALKEVLEKILTE